MKISPIEVTYIDHCGTDLSVVNAARVSFGKMSTFEWYDKDGRGPCTGPSPCGRYFNIQRLSDKDTKLIHYLAKHNHKSPFNHCFLSFRVKAPIFVARQLVKHEYLPWNEISRRYVDEEPEFYFPEYWRKKADNVKQGSSEDRVVLSVSASIFDYEEGDLTETPIQLCQYALEHYTALLKQGVCAEQARMILPQNTMTEWIWSGTLFAFVKMLKLRLDSHTQKETQEVAKLITPLIEKKFPVSYKALMEI